MDIWGCNVWWIWQTNQIFQFDDQFLTSFAWSLKKHVGLHHPDEMLYVFFCWLILDALCQGLLSAGLIGSICWNKLFSFLEETHNRGLLSNPTIYTTSHSLDKNWPLVWLVIVHFTLPYDLFHTTLLYSTTFHCLSQFVLKMKHFQYI